MKKKCMLIVEDEYWIRKSICELAEYVFDGNITIMESGNGEEALDILAENEVSIIFTDINMPFMDGITLISHIAKEYPDIPVLVLSGYSDFHLVRDALTGGALDYLLKPVKETEFKEAIHKAEKFIQISEEEKKKTEEVQRQKKVYENYNMDLVLSTYICQKETGDVEYSKERLEGYFRRIQFPTYMAVIQKNTKGKMDDSNESVLEKRYKRKKNLKEWMGSESFVWIENAYRQEEYIVFSSESIEKLERNCLRLKGFEQDPKNVSCSFRVCVSGKLSGIEDMRAVYKDIILKIVSNAEYGKAFQYINLRMQDKKNNFSHAISEELEYEIIQAFRQKNKGMVDYLLLDKLGIRNMEKDNWLLLEVKQVFSQLRSIIHSYYSRKLNMDEMWEVDNLFDSIETSVISVDTEEIIELTRQLSNTLLQEENSEAVSFVQQTDNIGKVVEYIGKHYTENLTLSYLAERFYLTPSYLSRSFKKQTGKNLVAYITEKRLEKAVDYIKAGDNSLTEVAFLVGYDDYSYFNKVFRRYMGISPTKYREDLEKRKNLTSE